MVSLHDDPDAGPDTLVDELCPKPVSKQFVAFKEGEGLLTEGKELGRHVVSLPGFVRVPERLLAFSGLPRFVLISKASARFEFP